MITIRKHALSGASRRVGTRPANPSLPPALSKLMRDSVAPETQAERKRIAVHDGTMTAGMKRIYEQYRAGAYCTDDYSTRTCQRHRKFFLSLGIDLRAPYRPSASPSPPKPELRTKQRKESLPATKNAKQRPLPESAPATSEPTCRKSKFASESLSRARRARVKQHRADRVVGLGALARGNR